jgi:pimeloyl-ACP methyl ester carboxylesterase
MDTKEDFVLAGLSFGGLAAIGINEIFPARRVFLISSISSRKELPLLYRIIGRLRLHRIVPLIILKSANPVLFWYFNAKSKNEKKLIEGYGEKVTPGYLKWSINTVLNWNCTARPQNIFHIQGTSDRIFPCRLTQADELVPGGGHLMVFDKPELVSAILSRELLRIG